MAINLEIDGAARITPLFPRLGIDLGLRLILLLSITPNLTYRSTVPIGKSKTASLQPT